MDAVKELDVYNFFHILLLWLYCIYKTKSQIVDTWVLYILNFPAHFIMIRTAKANKVNTYEITTRAFLEWIIWKNESYVTFPSTISAGDKNTHAPIFLATEIEYLALRIISSTVSPIIHANIKWVDFTLY